MLGIGIVGMPGSGKSIFSTVAKKYGIPVFVMGDAVREEVTNRGLKLTSENLMKVAEDLRRKYGRGAVAVLIVNKLKKLSSKNALPNIVIIEGLRSPEEREILRDFFDKFYIVAIHASPQTRYERILARKRLDDFRSVSELRKRDQKELEFGIGELLAMADFHLVNEDKSIETFTKECEDLLKKILSLDC